MDNRTWSKRLKLILAFTALGALAILLGLVPMLGRELASDYPELARWFWPWLLFIWAAALPCCMALALAWRVATSLEGGRVFCEENARRFGWISRLALGDAGFFLAGNIAMLLLNMHHPSVFLASMAVVFAGVAIAVVSACLAHCAKQAALLQAQSDLTI